MDLGVVYIECPTNYDFDSSPSVSLFLAGGITGCYDWQSDLVRMLQDTDLVLLNPRRKEWTMDTPEATEEQVRWEWYHLRNATAISFWFAEETIQPIALFELGRWSSKHKPIFVGVHPNYARRQDVEIQMACERPDVKLVYSSDDLANQIIESRD